MLSPTDLSTYTYCPRKLYLTKILKLAEIPRYAVIKGDIKHKIIEKQNKKEKEIIINTTKDNIITLYTRFNSEFLKIARDIIKQHLKTLKQENIDEFKLFKNIKILTELKSKKRAKLIQDFSQKHNIYGETLYKNLTPRIESEIKIQDKILNLRGIIDELEIYPEHSIPVELKSGKAPSKGAWQPHIIQLGAYILMLKNNHYYIKEGIVHYIDKDKRVIIPYNTFLKDKILDIIKKTKEILSSKNIPKHTDNKNKCKVCNLKEKCYNSKFIKTHSISE